ncbi:OPT family small oligopeptide transporter [Kwoniella newhampshirensis]|uniref:OPT family small oligopeptide transporter n=1 Tax=Kwoniella newhampshirensis TaxID=1651941 RepID=A0AAW0YXL0_9TREE
MSDSDSIRAAPATYLEDEKNLHDADVDDSKGTKDAAITNTHVLEVDHNGFEKKAEAVLEIGTNEEELARLEASIEVMSIERAVVILKQLAEMHRDDQNFPSDLLHEINDFLEDPSIAANPDMYPKVIRAMKLEAVLATENSPYVEVRVNVDPTDDPTMPVSTIRAWFIGIIFCAIGTFIDTLFAFRNPSISIGTNVAQLAAYPIGTFFARVLPDWRFRFFGEHSLNPGPFNRKEHMLISIMANLTFTAPYTFYIVPVQAMTQYFNMPFAFERGYQILISLAVNLFGYGMAGLLRRFLVYPSSAIWPGSLSTVALVKAFHSGINEPVKGPFNRTYKASREKIFLVGMIVMFCYYMFPGFIFQALSAFSWMTWIAPDNVNLTAVTGIYGGMGLNPWPTFDYNLSGGSGLYLPTYSVVNQVAGLLVAACIILAVWYTNTWNTGYLPINSNGTFDNTGGSYNVTAILNSKGALDEGLYQAYSKPFFGAGYIVYNMWAFASYTAAFSYVFLFHRKDIARGFKGVYRSFFKHDEEEDNLEEDIHYRLMKVYREVPEWHYLLLLILPIAFGCAAVAGYPTNATVGALFYGLIMPAVLILPIGIIQSVTGIPVALNILADIIGGVINAGHVNSFIYFKCWAYLSSWQALSFVGDLKLAHYAKIPPRITFWAQIAATFVYAIISSLEYNFIMGISDVCTEDASFRFTCPYQTSFYSATIFWGVISPKKLFGPGQQYNMMLLGFPLGFVAVGVYWALRRKFPRSKFLRSVHPVAFIMGPVTTATPYNLAYFIGNLYLNLFSFQYLRKHYLAFWAKWNYVISAAFSCGIAIAGLFIFFALELPKGGLSIDWWGNNVVGLGCEGAGGCPRLPVPDVGYFGPAPGSYS